MGSAPQSSAASAARLSACSELARPRPKRGRARRRAPGSPPGSRAASIAEARSISSRWPSRPNPVTSVQAVAPWATRQAAAAAADCSIVAIAPSTAARRGQPAHLGGEDHAGAERLRSGSAGRRALQPALAQQPSGAAAARSPQSRAPVRRPRRCGRRPAPRRPASSTSSAAAQHVKEVVLDDRRARGRQGGDRQRGLAAAPPIA